MKGYHLLRLDHLSTSVIHVAYRLTDRRYEIRRSG